MATDSHVLSPHAHLCAVVLTAFESRCVTLFRRRLPGVPQPGGPAVVAVTTAASPGRESREHITTEVLIRRRCSERRCRALSRSGCTVGVVFLLFYFSFFKSRLCEEHNTVGETSHHIHSETRWLGTTLGSHCLLRKSPLPRRPPASGSGPTPGSVCCTIMIH